MVGGTRAFYIDGTTVYADGSSKATFWIDGKYLYDGGGGQAKYYFND